MSFNELIAISSIGDLRRRDTVVLLTVQTSRHLAGWIAATPARVWIIGSKQRKQRGEDVVHWVVLLVCGLGCACRLASQRTGGGGWCYIQGAFLLR